MSFLTIRRAQQTIWPLVKDSLELHKESREATRNNPNATNAAKTRARVPWDRVVANEAVWALAKSDLLATPAEAKVIEAAVKWAETMPEEDVDHLDQEEADLLLAVEELTAEENSATVPNITKSN